MTWGTISLGRFSLRETWPVNDQVNATTGERSVSLSGEESQPPLTAPQLRARHDAVVGVMGAVLAIAFTDKTNIDGYYLVKDAGSTLTDYQGEVRKADWTLSLDRLGTESEVDIESRLTGTVRANDFGLTGERWHAPAIGHYGYYTGTTQPSSMTRTSEDGAITVYRQLPAGVSPRWGCAPADYPAGRVRVLSEQVEKVGINTPVAANWELSNALVRVRPDGGQLEVAAYDGTTWDAKTWNITVGASTVSSWDAVSILRNDFEQCVIRLASSRAPGRTTLDLTLRRGSRFVEGYLQADTSATLSVSLDVLENTTAPASSGYVVATSADADGNKYIAGSARNFSAHASGGITKTSTTTLDFFLGAVVGGDSAATGDDATVLRDQYIAALAESTAVVRR